MAHPSTLGTPAASETPTFNFGTLAELLRAQAYEGRAAAPLHASTEQYHRYCAATQTVADAAEFMAYTAEGLDWLIELTQGRPNTACTPQALQGLLQSIAAQLVAHAAALSSTLEKNP